MRPRRLPRSAAPQLRAVAQGVLDAHHGGEQLIGADVVGPLTGGQRGQCDIPAGIPGVAPAAPALFCPHHTTRLQVVGWLAQILKKSGVADEVRLFRCLDLLQAPAPAGDQRHAPDVSELDTLDVLAQNKNTSVLSSVTPHALRDGTLLTAPPKMPPDFAGVFFGLRGSLCACSRAFSASS